MSDKGKQYLRKILVLMPAVPVLAFGIALCVYSGLGSDTTTSCQQGISRLVGLEVGTVNQIYNCVILLAFLLFNRKMVGVGSVIVGFGLGPLMNLFLKLLGQMLPIHNGLTLNVTLSLSGIVLTCMALSWYMQAGVGVQPIDMVVISISKLIGRSYGTATYLYSGTMLICTIIFGGDIGVSTILNLTISGKLCDFFIKAFRPLVERATGDAQAGKEVSGHE